MPKIRVFCVFIILSILLVACRSNAPVQTQATTPQPENVDALDTPTAIPPTPTLTNTPTQTVTPEPPTATPTPVAYGPDNFPENVNPLTGLVVADPDMLNRRPVAVKINLVPRTSYRPAWGVSLADLIWEYYHNDGYTRLHAIFYSQDAKLAGAIRSGRLFDHDLVLMFKSIFTYGSADAQVNFRLLNASYSNRIVLEGQRSNCPATVQRPLCRMEPSGSDFLLVGTKELSQYVTNNGVENGRQNLNNMSFHQTPPGGGAPVEQAYIHYSIDSYARWDYDTKNGQYMLSMDNNLALTTADETYAPFLDRETNEPVGMENVVILVARHQYYQPPPNEIVEILMTGTGKAYALRDGQVYELTWNRPTFESIPYLTHADGSNYALKPGKTWFYVIGETSEVTQLKDGAWKFNFRFP
jgi:hypothetical protein